MAKVTEYPRITKMKDNDILLVDGPDGTRTILQTDASKQMGGEVVMVNETAGDSTKVVINTTNEDIELATMADLEPVEEDVSELKTQISEAVDTTDVWDEVELTVDNHGYYNIYGAYVDEAGRRNAIVTGVNPGDIYRLSTVVSSTLIAAIMYYDNATLLSYEKTGTGTQETVTDYEFTIPANCNKIIVQNSTGNAGEFELEKYVETDNVFRAYTKEESDAKYFGKTNGENLSESVSDIENVVFEDVPQWQNVELTVDNHGYYNIYGTYTSEANRRNAIVTGVIPGDLYRISTSVSSALIAAIMYYNDNNLLSYEKAGSGTPETLTNYEFTIPANCNKIIVQNSVANTPIFALEKYATVKEESFYTKDETDAKLTGINKKYGIKWEISDPDDLGTRCFDAVGLSATIGIGSTNGSSDFDNIYPWSEMKRCNIKVNTAGAKIVTFEGETGFALDGTNGDVFVRIPKFYYERYQENGFEYRVISAIGTNVHPAFIENGEELDEIFIGAFEGVIESNKLKSKGGIIPTSNEVGQTFLTAAQANGDNYSLYDNRCVDAVWNLMAIEYGLRNTNAIIGYGYADFLQAVSGEFGVDCDTSAIATNIFSAAKSIPEARLNNMPVGTNVVICEGTQDNCIAFRKLVSRTSDADHWYLTFDGDPVDLDTTCFIGAAGCTTNFCETVPSGALSWHTGRTNWIANSDTKNPVRYRWIENIVGSLWHTLPDITFNNLQMYQCKNMKDYVMHKYTDTYKAIGNTFVENADNSKKEDITDKNYWITELDNNIFAKGIDFGRTYDKALTSKKAFGAYYYLLTGVMAIVNGGGFDHLYRCNVLTQRAWLGATQKWYLYGARLIYKDVT